MTDGARTGKQAQAAPAPEQGDPRIKTRIRRTRAAAIVLVVALLFVAPAWGRHGLMPELLRWAGYAALITGVMGRVWCSAYIGGRKSQIIVDVGPYSLVRNPLYVFSFIGLLGIGLSTGMLAVTSFLAAVFALYSRGVVHGEEIFLTARHPKEFGDYVRRVPRWIPDFGAYREAEEPMGLPRNVLLTVTQSSAFFLAFPLFALIAWLQEAGLLPILLRLP